MNIKDIVILIPAYNPTKMLLKLVEDLEKLNFSKFLIVNDGSETSGIFDILKSNKNCQIIEYEANQGKGYALKYGIKYYLDHFSKYKGIVFCDADYQHLPEDIQKVAINLLEEPDKIILGTRKFNKKNPLANRLGNKITSFLFKILYGKQINDTQTGLRGIPNQYLDLCLEIPGERFEYEMEELITFVNKELPLKEVEIEAVYYKKNESKFDKIFDSIKIYRILLKESFRFLVTSLLSSFVDLFLFTIFIYNFSFLKDELNILFSTVIARIIADFINFKLTKYFVFDTDVDTKSVLIKYYILSFSKMIISASLVFLFSRIIPIDKPIIKIFVDVLIYFISYRI